MSRRDDARRRLAWLRDRTPEMLDLLEQLVRIESPSQDAAAQGPLLDCVADQLAVLGYRIRRTPGRTSGGALFATPRERRRGRGAQLLLGHVDTVWPLGTLSRMPFERDAGCIRGPGVYDMKGGLVQMLFALRALQNAGTWPELAPLVFLNTDEEIGSAESVRHVRLLARHVSRVFVLEPSLGPEGRLKTTRKGVGRFHLRITGRAAHAGLDPESGINAIVELAHVVQALNALNDPERGISVNVGQVHGGVTPNVVAPESEAQIDVRVPGVEDATRIEARIRGLEPTLPGARIDVSGSFRRMPLEATPRNRALWAQALAVAEDLGLPLGEGAAGGASDGNTTSLYAPTLDGLGAVGDGAHAPHEHLRESCLAERSALLAGLLLAPLAETADGP